MSSLPNVSAWAAGPAVAAPTRGVQNAVRVFHERFGVAPRWLAVAPGRVNLIGEHTDYNGGYVLPLAVDRHVVIAAGSALAEVGRLRAYSAALDATVDIRLDGSEGPGAPTWANYLRGVVRAFATRGLIPPSIDAVIVSELPLGGGLSSSAALEVATATLLEQATGTTLDPRDKARLCRQAEHEFAGVPCGLMDQLASVFGDAAGVLLIDCPNEKVRVIPFADPAVSVLVCNTNTRHALADGAYARRRTECEAAARQLGVTHLCEASPAMVEAAGHAFDPIARRRARHVTTENLRTLAAGAHLEARAFAEVGQLMYQSHQSLRDDFEVSSAELDTLIDIARALGVPGGVLGARMTGGGFGGCAVVLARTDSVDTVAEKLTHEYWRRTGLHATTFVARPARGAHAVDPQTLR